MAAAIGDLCFTLGLASHALATAPGRSAAEQLSLLARAAGAFAAAGAHFGFCYADPQHKATRAAAAMGKVCFGALASRLPRAGPDGGTAAAKRGVRALIDAYGPARRRGGHG